MDIRSYNRDAWDRQVENGNRWTVPVTSEVIAAARHGEWQLLLAPTKSVPSGSFPDLTGLEVLCLASGGGQQGPILAAAGAIVTVLDNSTKQLEQDRTVAVRKGLSLQTVEGDMADLAVFLDGRFGLIFHPVSNCFAPAGRPVWLEAFRVLRPGGVLLAGFCNPALYIFDDAAAERGELLVRHAVPYADLTNLTETRSAARLTRGWCSRASTRTGTRPTHCPSSCRPFIATEPSSLRTGEVRDRIGVEGMRRPRGILEFFRKPAG